MSRRSKGGAEVKLYPFINLGARWVWVVTPSPVRSYPGKDSVPIVQEAGWAPGPVWTGVENLVPQLDSIPGPSSPYQAAILVEGTRRDNRNVCEVVVGKREGKSTP